jgi:type IV pilus assembly protein PilQ
MSRLWRVLVLITLSSISLMVCAQDAEPAPSNAFAQYDAQVSGLSFQNISVRGALFQLADIYGFNLIASDSVVGEITLEINDVPWDQALALVLRLKKLSGRLEGNVLYVAPAAELAEQDRRDIDAALAEQALAPLLSEFLQVNYANGDDLLQLIVGSAEESAREADSTATVAGHEQPRGLLSPRGSAAVDKRTNTLIVRDIAENLQGVRTLLAALDVPVRQVLIEARIVNVETNVGRELGIRWGLAGRLGTTRADDWHQAERAFDSEATLTVDLGVADPFASRFAVGYARSSGLIDLELSALESSGNGEVIARPKVTTQDKMPALIQSGVRIPYQSQAGGTAGGSTTEFEEALLSLGVTPQITPDGRINMLLDIRQDSISPRAGLAPAISTNSVMTRVLVNDGETIVLGGVFREELATSESKTPLLGDLPYVGRLFKRTERSSRRTELLIFITPRILLEGID